MPEKVSKRVLQRIQSHAYERLSFEQRERTNLYYNPQILERGAPIGPAFQKIVAPRTSVLVFADDEPLANFGHPCRYLLYDDKTGAFLEEAPSRFPPLADARQPVSLAAFHEPLRLIENPNLYRRVTPIWCCPVVSAVGTRYAILFSGMSNKRHLNDMEFLYRTLVDIYDFDPDNLYVLNYDGSLRTQEGLQVTWPGDSTAYRIQVTGSGNQAGFEAAIDDLKTHLKRDDTLLIHCNNHGGCDLVPGTDDQFIAGTAYLCTYPSWGNYYNADFADKLAELPQFKNLIVMLEQCHAGGFNASILSHSTADATSVASAATEFKSSYVTADGNWDPFARDWIAAQTGHNPFGGALSYDPDSNHDGEIQAEEAYLYANAVKDPRDTPNYSESSAAGGEISLGQEYVTWGWWCKRLYYELEKYRIRLPDPEYYVRLNKIRPELHRLTIEIDRASAQLQKDMEARIAAVVKEGFGR